MENYYFVLEVTAEILTLIELSFTKEVHTQTNRPLKVSLHKFELYEPSKLVDTFLLPEASAAFWI